MSETHIAASGGTSTWTEKEIRQQPDSWLHSLKNIASLRHQIDTFLAPLTQNPDLKIILTGAGTSAFIGDIIAPLAVQTYRQKLRCGPHDRPGDQPHRLLNAGAADAAGFFRSLRQQPGKRRSRRVSHSNRYVLPSSDGDLQRGGQPV